MLDSAVRIEMFSRPGCHLCDEARDVIEQARSHYPFKFRIINIENERKLEAAYGTEIPVVRINGNKAFKYRVDSQELERKLRRLWNR